MQGNLSVVGVGQARLRGLFRHSDVNKTQIYAHVLNRGPVGLRSPMDRRGLLTGA